MFRTFDVRVGVGTTQVAEFSVGDTVEFHDEFTGNKGIAVIKAFAQDGYNPLVWYVDDKGDYGSVHLGWCKKKG